MRGNLRTHSFVRAENVGDHLAEPRSFGRRPRFVELRADSTTPNQVHGVRARVTGNRIHERKRRDSEAQAEKLLFQKLQTPELVAQRCRALEFEPLAGGLHLLSESRQWSVVRAVEEGTRKLHALPVLARRASADAGTEALLHLETNATRRARKHRKQLRLIGEMHRLVERAIAQAKRVVELANGLADALRSLEGPVVHRRVIVARSANHDELRCRAPRELQEAEVPAVALHGDVEPWPELLD